MAELIIWFKNNIDFFALIIGSGLLLFDWFDAYAKYISWAQLKRSSPIAQLVHSGRPSREYLGHLTFKLYTTKFELDPIDGWENDERIRSWLILVRETLASRTRRRLVFANAPNEMDFVEVAHRRIIPPQPSHIASFTAIEWQTPILRRTGFYQVAINTNRENLSPGPRVKLKSGAIIVKMNVRYINDDNTPDGQATFGK